MRDEAAMLSCGGVGAGAACVRPRVSARATRRAWRPHGGSAWRAGPCCARTNDAPDDMNSLSPLDGVDVDGADAEAPAPAPLANDTVSRIVESEVASAVVSFIAVMLVVIGVWTMSGAML